MHIRSGKFGENSGKHQNNGGKCEMEIHDQPDWGIRAVHLRNPNRTLIELYTEFAEDKWRHVSLN